MIILINGLPRAGKDTIADYIVQKYNYKKTAFADELKNIICRTFNIDRETLDDYKNMNTELCIDNGGRYEEILNFRELLQRFGTEGMKPIFGNDIWAKLTWQNIEDNTVIPDFRFLCEGPDYIDVDIKQKYDIITVLVKDKRDLPLEGHKSDVELYQNNFKFDYTIENTGTLEELYRKVDDLILN